MSWAVSGGIRAGPWRHDGANTRPDERGEAPKFLILGKASLAREGGAASPAMIPDTARDHVANADAARIAEIRTIDPLRLEGDAQSLREPPQLFAERRIGRRVERQQSVQWASPPISSGPERSG